MMITTEKFIEKIEILLDYYNLTASLFAEKIGVQRSSLSHLMSGRNKPSLDFVVKIIEEFPEVDLYWFLFNQGSFPKSNYTNELQIEKQVEKPINNTNIINNEQSREILPLSLFESPKEKVEEVELQKEELKELKIETNIDKIPQSKNIEVEEEINYQKEEQFINNISTTNIPISTRNPSKVKKLLLIYEDGFFEEYNYR